METERFYRLRSMMENAFAEGQIEESKKLAHEFLEVAESKKPNWNYGNALHHANLILGRISLREGSVEKARQYLIKAGKTPGSPQLNSFGPNMKLAKELLEMGEKQTVLEYLELCKVFWKKIFSWMKIRKWKRTIEKGEIPDFRANLLY